QLWQHKANTDIRVHPGLFFVESKAGPCVGCVCVTAVPTGADPATGRSSLILRSLATGTVIAQRPLKGLDYRIRLLPRGRILLRHGRATSLLELR
ncbi:MAG: hypothetical protein R6V58_15840, partial [Planctomycetota bacterium]